MQQCITILILKYTKLGKKKNLQRNWLDFDLSKKSGHHGKNIQDFFENILLQIIF